MGIKEDLIAAGATKIVKKKYFACECDGVLNEQCVEVIKVIDCNGDPITPHVWVPPGKEFSYYNEDDKKVIERKIRDKEAPELVVVKKEMKK